MSPVARPKSRLGPGVKSRRLGGQAWPLVPGVGSLSATGRVGSRVRYQRTEEGTQQPHSRSRSYRAVCARVESPLRPQWKARPPARVALGPRTEAASVAQRSHTSVTAQGPRPAPGATNGATRVSPRLVPPPPARPACCL